MLTKKRFFYVVFQFGLVGIVGGCEGIVPKEAGAQLPSAVPNELGVIGPSGGHVSYEVDGWRARIEVEPGVLEHDRIFTGARATGCAPGAVGPIFDLGPSGAFERPVKVTITPHSDEVGVITKLRLATCIDGGWVTLPEAAAGAGEVAGFANHFSEFALVT